MVFFVVAVWFVWCNTKKTNQTAKTHNIWLAVQPEQQTLPGPDRPEQLAGRPEQLAGVLERVEDF